MLAKLQQRPQKSAYIILLLLALFSAIYNAFLPLHGDEAYYWVWSHHLQGGYFDHAPLIAYFIALTNFISEAEWGVRLVNVISMTLSGYIIFKLACEIFDEEVAIKSLLIFSSIILVHAGYILTTPDSPLILFWSLSLYFGYFALHRGNLSDYILAGFSLGLMMLSKYTAILFIFAIFIYILIKKREVLQAKGFYLASFIALIVVSPMLWWNYQNDWISFTFQLEHGSSKSSEIYPNLALEFFAGQFGIFSPLFAGVLFYYLYKKRLFYEDNRLFFLSLFSVIVILFFTYKALFTRMELNYTAPAYISAAIICGYIFHAYNLERLFKISLITALIFTLLGRILFITNLEIVQDRMYGNKESVEALQKYLQEGERVYGDHLTIAAYLTYYLKDHPYADVGLESRFSQYDMWRGDAKPQDGLFLTRDPEEIRLQMLYGSVELLESLTFARGANGTKTLYIYRVKDPKVD